MEVKEIFTLEATKGNKIPLFSMSVSAGIPISVDSEIEEEIDLKAVHAELVEAEKSIKVAKKKQNAFLKELGLPPLP
ncbi:MAG: hypothetical protein L3J49_14540 [Desulfobulbaceae bacterium]|nr:hypothetical protein [Desulfobulbaceae bacterium]